MDLNSRIAKNTREYDMMMIMMTDEINSKRAISKIYAVTCKNVVNNTRQQRSLSLFIEVMLLHSENRLPSFCDITVKIRHCVDCTIVDFKVLSCGI
jgi:hypothetical protein